MTGLTRDHIIEAAEHALDRAWTADLYADPVALRRASAPAGADAVLRLLADDLEAFHSVRADEIRQGDGLVLAHDRDYLNGVYDAHLRVWALLPEGGDQP